MAESLLCGPSAAGTSARREFLEARPVGSFDRVPGVPPTAMWLLIAIELAIAAMLVPLLSEFDVALGRTTLMPEE